MNEERTGSSNNNCNVSVVICGTDIPLRLTNKGNNKITEHRAIFSYSTHDFFGNACTK
jgi:hypothetical protein